VPDRSATGMTAAHDIMTLHRHTITQDTVYNCTSLPLPLPLPLPLLSTIHNAAPCSQFCAIVNINLAVVNTLPLPALDGGYLVLLALEALRGGKKLPEKFEQVCVCVWDMVGVNECVCVRARVYVSVCLYLRSLSRCVFVCGTWWG
jgi:hypothetical protein